MVQTATPQRRAVRREWTGRHRLRQPRQGDERHLPPRGCFETAHGAENKRIPVRLAASGTSGAPSAGTTHSSEIGEMNPDDDAHDDADQCLVDAWRPYAGAQGRVVGDGGQTGGCSGWRRRANSSMRDIAAESLNLLRATLALSDANAGPVPRPVHDEVYAVVIGMFELNNLEVAAASPVEDYFLAADETFPEDRPNVSSTSPGRVDVRYCVRARAPGSSVLTAQQRLRPNGRPGGRRRVDGSCVLVAKRAVKKGEELTMCYVDEDADVRERRAGLRITGSSACSGASAVGGPRPGAQGRQDQVTLKTTKVLYSRRRRLSSTRHQPDTYSRTERAFRSSVCLRRRRFFVLAAVADGRAGGFLRGVTFRERRADAPLSMSQRRQLAPLVERSLQVPAQRRRSPAPRVPPLAPPRASRPSPAPAWRSVRVSLRAGVRSTR